MAKFMIFCFAFAFCQIFDVNGKPKRLNIYETVKDIETIERELKEVFMKNKRGSNDHGGNEVAETTVQPTTTFQITSTEDGNEATSTERPEEGGNHPPTGPTTSAWQPSSAGSTGPGSTAGAKPTTSARGSTGPGSTADADPTTGARRSTGPGSTAGAGPTTGARGSTGPGSTAGAGPTTGARGSTGPGSTAGAGPTTGARGSTGPGSTAGAQPTNGAGPTGVESLGTAEERRDRPQKDEHKYGNGSGGQIQPWMRSLSKLSDELKTERKRSSKVKSLHKKVNILEKRLAHLKRQLDNIA